MSRAEAKTNAEAELEAGPETKRAREEGRFGYVHSEQTGSALDGPGLRTVFWLSGCEFRCTYCHNPDTWRLHTGRRLCVEEVLAEIGKYAKFMRASRGGVTISGGEPLVQYAFCMNLLRGARELGVHTALDTNGFHGARMTDEDLQLVDLFLLDLKSWDARTHLSVTGQARDPVLAFARRLDAARRPAWVRFVLVPGVTDDPENVAGVAQFCATLSNVERVEVLPFHQLGREKWRALGTPYALAETLPPSPEDVERVRQVFRAAGVKLCS